MWYAWIVLTLTCALVEAAPTSKDLNSGVVAVEGVATTVRPAHRTLDRQAGELAWRTWLQSPENGNPNAPSRRITTKSLFITPLVCPKGQRLESEGCVQVLTVNKDDHERILLEQLNALFTSAPGSDVLYDYGDTDPGPLQLSIPIGLEPQASPLQSNDGSIQNQDIKYVNIDKKDDVKPFSDASIEAELELLKLSQKKEQNNPNFNNKISSQNFVNNFIPLPDKPKRENNHAEETESQESEITTQKDEGQKEVVFGHVNVDPVLYPNSHSEEEVTTETSVNTTPTETEATTTDLPDLPQEDTQEQVKVSSQEDNTNSTNPSKQEFHELKSGNDLVKLSPENDYSDIGEAIKLISRYAEVTTDDNFSKDQKKYANIDDGILGTRTKLQYRRNKLKPAEFLTPPHQNIITETRSNDNPAPGHLHQSNAGYYRYPWGVNQRSATPPPNYPFRHIQDYWQGRPQVGGLYNHENPRRHHHSYNYFRPHGYYPYGNGFQNQGSYNYPGVDRGPHALVPGHADLSPGSVNQDLYSVLGLRHWFSGEGNSKR